MGFFNKDKRVGIEKWYDSLPLRTSPKTEAVKTIASRCGVSENTARNWIKGNTKPADSVHLAVLSEITGIDADKLFI